MKAIIITPPAKVFEGPYKKIFLAGSIEMGKAEDWQRKIIDAVQDSERIIFNPRRENWDASWEQSIDNQNFKEQVDWELSALECSDMIIMNLIPETMSPISLLEFGLFARSGKLVVYCPSGFWRKGNVDVVCEKYKIPCNKFTEKTNIFLPIISETI
jgi:hypothetical protein